MAEVQLNGVQLGGIGMSDVTLSDVSLNGVALDGASGYQGAPLYWGTPSGGILPKVGTTVYVRKHWGDTWTWCPFVYPVTVTDAAAPSVGTAVLEYDMGLLNRPEFRTWDYWLPYLINGCYVAIWVHNPWGNAPLWCGITEREVITPNGSSAYPGGRQQWNAFSLEHLLDRVTIRGSYTETGFIDLGLTFNRRDNYGLGWKGNRTTDLPGSGVHSFSSDGATWSNLDILVYLLANYSPLPISLGGLWDALDDITEDHDFRGGTLKQAIDKLVDPHRGLGWRLVPHINDTIYLEVFSMLSDPVVFYDEYIPANPNQAIINLDNTPILEPQLTYEHLSAFDTIRIEGGPIGVCFSLSFADGTLAEGWSQDLEDAYVAGSEEEGADAEDHDAERATDTYRDILKFSVPSDWDWMAGDGEGGAQNTVMPFVREDGYLDPAGAAYVGKWKYGQSFERHIPLYTLSLDGHYESRLAFALIQDADDRYYFVDQLHAVGQAYNSAHLLFADNELAFWLRSSNLPHYFMLNHWDEETTSSMVQATFDYESLIATVFLRTTSTIAVTARTQLLPYGDQVREKTIRDYDAQLWIILPGTVTGVSAGALIKDVEGSVVRSDVDKLRKKAAFAAAYYGQQRATMQLVVKDIVLSHAPGSIIRGAFNAGYFLNIGTVVTSRTWDFETRQTTITTGFREIL